MTHETLFLTVLKQITHRHFYYSLLHILIWSILFSKAGISISIGLLVLLSLIRVQSIQPINIYINKAFFSLKTYKAKHWGFYGLIGLFILTCMSGMNSENITAWLHFLKIKGPYLLLPIVFLNHPPLQTKVYQKLYFSLITVMTVSSLFVLGNYFMDHTAITDSIKYGKSLQTPLSHVKFSVLLAMAAIVSVILSRRIESKKTILLSVGAFLIITIHTLAVRSGLVVLYLVGGLLLLHHLLHHNRIKQFTLAICILILAPILAYYTIPSVYHKVHYVKHDLKMIQQGQTANYSDGERIRSLEIGVDMIKKNPVFGIGIGDVRDASNEYYADWFPDSQKKILPHNQFVLAWASYGIFGLILFSLCLFSALIGFNINSQTLLFSLVFTLFIYGMVEKPLDEYVFVSVHALFACAGLSHHARRKSNTSMP